MGPKELMVHEASRRLVRASNLYMSAGDFKHADGAFKSLLASAEECEGHTCKLDGYANASLAWIQIQLARARWHHLRL